MNKKENPLSGIVLENDKRAEDYVIILPRDEREIAKDRKNLKDRIRRFNRLTLLCSPFFFVIELFYIILVPFTVIFNNKEKKSERLRMLLYTPLFIVFSPIAAIWDIVSDWYDIKNGIKDGTRDEKGNYIEPEDYDYYILKDLQSKIIE